MRISDWSSDVCSSDLCCAYAAIVLFGVTEIARRAEVTEGALVSASQGTLLTTIEQIDRVYVNFGQSSSDLLAIRGDMGSGKVSVPQLERVEVQLILEDGSAYPRSEEHTSELQSLMRTSYAVLCLKQKNKN